MNFYWTFGGTGCQGGNFIFTVRISSCEELFRLYIKWSLGLKHVVLGGGGNVTFGVYMGLAPLW